MVYGIKYTKFHSQKNIVMVTDHLVISSNMKAPETGGH